MAITHFGRTIPRDPTPFVPGNPEWVEIAFEDSLVTQRGGIETVEWWVDDGWTVGVTEGPLPVTAEGETYTYGLRALLTPPEQDGVFRVSCTVTFFDGSELERSRYVTVAQL